MFRTHVVAALVDWQTWLNSATLVFAAWLALRFLRHSTGLEMYRDGSNVGLPVSVGLFFIAFALFARRQRRD